MACNRCSVCAINYPTNVSKCWACGDPTSRISNADVAEDWRDQAADMYAVREIADETPEDFPILHAAVTEHDGRLFISSWEICQGGFQTLLQADNLVKVGNQVYEIVGYIPSLREYWVECLTDSPERERDAHPTE